MDESILGHDGKVGHLCPTVAWEQSAASWVVAPAVRPLVVRCWMSKAATGDWSASSALPSSQTIYGIVVMLSLNRTFEIEAAPGLVCDRNAMRPGVVV